MAKAQHLEIERKFLLLSMPDDALKSKPVEIEQAYLAVEEGGNEVRVRKQDDYYTLTAKSNGGLTRQECEIEISESDYLRFRSMCHERVLRKQRIKYPMNAHTAEIDLYQAPFDSLRLVEVEFRSSSEAKQFHPPDWMGEEVTDNPKYRARHLLISYRDK